MSLSTGEAVSTAWVSDFAPHEGPRYLQIVEFIERAISDDRLRPGDRLPPQRQLAELLNVDLTTITRSYNEARKRHLLEAHGAAGTYVSAPKVDLTQIPDMSMNIPPPSSVDLDEVIRQGVSQVLIRNDVDLLMTYHLGGGSTAARVTGAQWLAPMFDNLSAGRIAVCPGAQSAIAALLLSLTKPGETILTEPMVYPGMQSAAAQLGRKLHAVAVDAHGALPDAIEEESRRTGAKVLYLNPTLQNPTSATMPLSRRREIAEMAQRCNIRIIEDDPYWLLADQPPKPIATYAPEHTYYISTLSKCLSPGLRTAYVVLPKGIEQDTFLTALRSFVLTSAPMMTALATYWISEGIAGTILRGTQVESRARQELARRILGSGMQGATSGIHVWYKLPSYWSAQEFSKTARYEGLNIVPADVFNISHAPVNAIRISLGHAKDRITLGNALRKLNLLVARQPELHQGVVV
jgi:DNA-binding transcriptional MocR family regulator